MDKETMSIYLEGANELLNEMEEAILHLSERPDDMNEINRLFRVMHSLKGSSAMVELNDVADFSHKLESECDYFRQGKAMVSAEFLKLVLRAHDQIKILIFSHFDGEAADTNVSELLIREIQNIRNGSAGKSFDYSHEENRLIKQMMSIKTRFSALEKLSVADLKILSCELTKFAVLSRRLQKESVSEFFEPFEKFLRDCKNLGLEPPAETLGCFCAAIAEAERMLCESNVEIAAVDFSPEALLKSLQVALDLKENLAKIKRQMDFPESRLPDEKKVYIRISSSTGTSIFNPQTMKDAISILGGIEGNTGDSLSEKAINKSGVGENELSN